MLLKTPKAYFWALTLFFDDECFIEIFFSWLRLIIFENANI